MRPSAAKSLRNTTTTTKVHARLQATEALIFRLEDKEATRWRLSDIELLYIPHFCYFSLYLYAKFHYYAGLRAGLIFLAILIRQKSDRSK
jgi:hypothetical protein